MWAQAAGAALTFFSKNKDEKNKFKQTKQEMALESMYGRENSQFDTEQAYYYQQLKRQEAMRGLDEFRKFSTVKNYAPGYVNTNPGPVLPDKPTYNTGSYSNVNGKTAKAAV